MLAMAVSLFPMTLSVSAEGEQPSVAFRYYDETAKVFRNSKFTDSYTPITSDTKAWTTGWYVASGTVTISGGNVTANGGEHKAGIGGKVTISGGTVTANGGYNIQ